MKIASKSPFLCVNQSHIRYGVPSGTEAMRYIASQKNSGIIIVARKMYGSSTTRRWKFLIQDQKLAMQKFRRKLIFKNFQLCIALKIVVGNLAVYHHLLIFVVSLCFVFYSLNLQVTLAGATLVV